MRRKSCMRVSAKATVGWSTRFRAMEVLQGRKTRSWGELRRERKGAEAVRHGLGKKRANLRASVLESANPSRKMKIESQLPSGKSSEEDTSLVPAHSYRRVIALDDMTSASV